MPPLAVTKGVAPLPGGFGTPPLAVTKSVAPLPGGFGTPPSAVTKSLARCRVASGRRPWP
jgi:hypothetical protein